MFDMRTHMARTVAGALLVAAVLLCIARARAQPVVDPMVLHPGSLATRFDNGTILDVDVVNDVLYRVSVSLGTPFETFWLVLDFEADTAIRLWDMTLAEESRTFSKSVGIDYVLMGNRIIRLPIKPFFSADNTETVPPSSDLLSMTAGVFGLGRQSSLWRYFRTCTFTLDALHLDIAHEAIFDLRDAVVFPLYCRAGSYALCEAYATMSMHEDDASTEAAMIAPLPAHENAYENTDASSPYIVRFFGPATDKRTCVPSALYNRLVTANGRFANFYEAPDGSDEPNNFETAVLTFSTTQKDYGSPMSRSTAVDDPRERCLLTYRTRLGWPQVASCASSPTRIALKPSMFVRSVGSRGRFEFSLARTEHDCSVHVDPELANRTIVLNDDFWRSYILHLDYAENVVVLMRHDVHLHLETGTSLLVIAILLVLFFWFGQQAVVFYDVVIVHHTIGTEIAGLVVVLAAFVVHTTRTDVHASSTHDTIVLIVVALTLLLWALEAVTFSHWIWLKKLLESDDQKSQKRTSDAEAQATPKQVAAPLDKPRTKVLSKEASKVFTSRREAIRVVAFTGVVRRSALLLALLFALWITILSTRRDSLNTVWSFIILAFLVFIATHISANLLTFYVLQKKHLPVRYRVALLVLAIASLALLGFLIFIFARIHLVPLFNQHATVSPAFVGLLTVITIGVLLVISLALFNNGFKMWGKRLRAAARRRKKTSPAPSTPSTQPVTADMRRVSKADSSMARRRIIRRGAT